MNKYKKKILIFLQNSAHTVYSYSSYSSYLCYSIIIDYFNK